MFDYATEILCIQGLKDMLIDIYTEYHRYHNVLHTYNIRTLKQVYDYTSQINSMSHLQQHFFIQFMPLIVPQLPRWVSSVDCFVHGFCSASHQFDWKSGVSLFPALDDSCKLQVFSLKDDKMDGCRVAENY